MSVSGVTENVAEEIVEDLLRSSWLIEAGRSELYRAWAHADPRYERFAERTEGRAAVFERALGERGRKPDSALVGPHSSWMRSVGGFSPEEVPLGNLFIPRLGDWVEKHAAHFLDSGADEVRDLGNDERSELTFPETFPQPPPFEPVAPVPVEPPGEVRFRFGILADLHFGSPRGEACARAAIADLNSSGAELVIQLGDLTDHGDLEEWDLAKATLAKLEMPFATMMGNHDVYSHREERLSGREYYPRSFGREPDGVVLEHKGFRFAVLDSIEHGASPFPPFDFATGGFAEGTAGAIVRGSLSAPQHDILADLAAPGGIPAFLFLHHPPQPFVAFPPILFGLRDADSGRLHATADAGNLWGVFAGHTHRNARTRTYDGVPVHEVGIPRDYPFGYALVDVTENGYAYRFMQISDEDLLRDAYSSFGELFRRYGRGDEIARGFVWTKPPS